MKLLEAVCDFDRAGTRKGDMGRVALIGGSRLYTGAPYFAARAAVRTGIDLVYVHCDCTSAVSLKTLLPEAIVDTFDEVNRSSTTWPWLSNETTRPHVNSFLLGCGLGKDVYAKEVICRLLRLRTVTGVNIIFDGDALRHCLTPDLLKWMTDNPENSYYLTPNEKEYQHLSLVSDMTSLPPHICVLRKGQSDTIYTANNTYTVEHETADPEPRKPGGIGDLLAGVLAAVTTMTSVNMKRLKMSPTPSPLMMQANAHLASLIVRSAVSEIVEREPCGYASYIPQDVLEVIGKHAERQRHFFATDPKIGELYSAGDT